MTGDARFAEGADQPMRLKALDPADLDVISTLVQDAVFQQADMTWARKARRFGLLVNRFRWETAAGPPERVRAMLVVENVLNVQSRGLPAPGGAVVLSLLSLTWLPRDEVAGRLTLTLAGDAEAAFDVEALEVVLQDVTRPYAAPSGRRPGHPE